MNSKAPEKTERLIALLGLAATNSGRADTCPSDEQLAAFIANRLEGQARQRMLAHLNRCPPCYHHWLEAAASLNANTEPAAEHKISPLPTLRQRFITWLTPWKLAVPIAAAATLACVTLLWPPSPDLDKQISADYAAIANHGASRLDKDLRNLPMPWENLTLGFNAAESSLPKKAFGAGLWTGKTALLGMGTSKSPLPEFLSPPSESAWPETEWAGYYQFGRWVMLLWVLTQAEEPLQDWGQLQRILAKLQVSLVKRPSSELEASQALSALERLQPLLAEAQRQTDPAARTHLSQRLEMIMQQLGPAK